MAWANDRKRTDRDPGYTGNLKVGGQEYWVSIWVEEDTRNPGKKRLSIATNPKNKDHRNATGTQTSRNDEPFPDDDVPF